MMKLFPPCFYSSVLFSCMMPDGSGFAVTAQLTIVTPVDLDMILLRVGGVID